MSPTEQPPPASDVAAIIVAAGSGTRFGGSKQYEELRGRRVMDWSLAAARATCAFVVLVVSSEFESVDAPDADVVVVGGSTRSESVRAGLAAVSDDFAIVVVHDAARPLADRSLFSLVIETVRGGVDAAVPGVSVTDTLRHREPGKGPVDRDSLISVQTPQAFRATVIRKAHANAPEATDDATLVDMAGGRVVVVPGMIENRKITEPIDLTIADVLLAEQGAWGAFR